VGWHAFFLFAISKFIYLVINGAYRHGAQTKGLVLMHRQFGAQPDGRSVRAHYAEDWLEPYSAGLEPKGMNPYSVRVMEGVGIDISGQRSKSVREYMGTTHIDYLVTVCQQAEENCPTTFLGFGDKLHWGFDDPAAFQGTEQATLAKFREVRDLIEMHVKAWLAELSEAHQFAL
jgi:arsenate reductase